MSNTVCEGFISTNFRPGVGLLLNRESSISIRPPAQRSPTQRYPANQSRPWANRPHPSRNLPIKPRHLCGGQRLSRGGRPRQQRPPPWRRLPRIHFPDFKPSNPFSSKHNRLKRHPRQVLEFRTLNRSRRTSSAMSQINETISLWVA
jgi:hypothetical protein